MRRECQGGNDREKRMEKKNRVKLEGTFHQNSTCTLSAHKTAPSHPHPFQSVLLMLARLARGLISSRTTSRTSAATSSILGNRAFSSMSAQSTADELIALPVAVFSKSYCPYVAFLLFYSILCKPCYHCTSKPGFTHFSLRCLPISSFSLLFATQLLCQGQETS
jgi:hypothetical protein